MKKQIITAILIITGIVGSGFADVSTYFTEATNTGITPEPTDAGYSTAAFGDYNNDGFLDIAVTEFTTYGATDGKMLIFTNTPSNPGHFTVDTLESSGGPARQVAWGDFDNDGDLDLFADVTNHNYLWRNSGSPDFNLELVGGSSNSDAILDTSHNEQGAGWIDANQDGKLDLFVTEGGYGGGYIHRNTYSISDSANPLSWFESIEQKDWDNTDSTMPNGSYSMAGDFDNDGKPDIFYSVDATYNTTTNKQRVWIWHNNTLKNSSTFNFDEVGETILDNPYSRTQTTSSIQWSGVVLWDADNDGDLDLFIGWGNGYNQDAVDQFYKNTCGYNKASSTTDIFQEQTGLDFANGSTATYSGGVTAGDVNNNGFMDLYVVHGKNENHKLYINNGNLSFSENVGIKQSGYANGATFGDVDNDGDIDLFLCNGGKLYLNTTNSTNAPAHPKDTAYTSSPSGINAEHYLDVMVSGASADSAAKTKDGIGSRVYLFHMTSNSDTNASYYTDKTKLVGMREIDGGSGYGSQATQVQHFGLPTTWGDNPQLEHYAIRVRFLNGDTLWKWNVVPDSVDVNIPYGTNNSDTTWLAQTIEVSLLELFVPPITRVSIEANPATATIPAGDSVTFKGTVWTQDKNGNEVKNDYYSQKIQWSYTPITAGLDTTQASIAPSQDSISVFTSTEAYAQYRVRAYIVNPDDPTDVDSAIMTVTTTAGAATHISIEKSSAQPTDRSKLIDDDPLGTVTLSKTVSDTNVYAILRDTYGNWVGLGSDISWSSSDVSIATLASADSPDIGKGHIKRIAHEGTVTGTASKSGLTSGTVTVTLEDITYTELRIIGETGDTLTSLTMRTDQDTSLFALGKNSATGAWEAVTVNWSISGVSTDSTPPNDKQTWTVYPSASGNGTITIAKTDIPSHSISVTFTKGQPKELTLYKASGTPDTGGNDSLTSSIIEITANSAYDIYAKIFDQNHEWLSEYETDPGKSGSITWTVLNDNNENSISSLDTSRGSHVVFKETKAHHIYTVVSSFTYSSVTYTDTVEFKVNPATATKLFIEPSNDNTSNTENPIDTIKFTSTDKYKYAYAILRDNYGNYVRASQVTVWTSADESIVIDTVADAVTGQGKITRIANSGQTTITAKDNTTGTELSDNAIAFLNDISYDSLRILDASGNDVTSFTMRTDTNTSLFAKGLRSDDSTWEAIEVNWSITGIGALPTAPNNSSSWDNLSPTDTGTGSITITLSGVTDNATITATPGLPHHTNIYSQSGNPESLNPYPDTIITAKAGVAIPLVAKIFDHNAVWLGEYETNTSLSAKISWSVNDVTIGSFDTTKGFSSNYTPTKAYDTVTITSKYQSGDTTLLDSIKFSIQPTSPHALYIEHDYNNTSPNTPAPIGTITLSSTDTTKSGYAILRDVYGNYIAPSKPTGWTSNDTNIVKVRLGFIDQGEGIVRRNAPSGNTVVTAYDSTNSLSATVNVTVEPYNITAVRIVLQDKSDIDNLVMRTDQDTTLQVLGKRSDDGEWEPVDGDWSITNNLASNAPTAENWDIIPNDTGSGTITVTYSGNSDMVTVKFNPGLPARTDIYSSEGDPATTGDLPYANSTELITVNAGDTIPLVAKIFDHKDYWLGEYETNASLSGKISWSSSSADGGVFNSATTGFKTSFTPTKAYGTLYLISKYQSGDTTLLDSIRIAINPGTPHDLYIEASPNQMASPNTPQPVDPITISSTDTTKSGYAVLRDIYGNYVKTSNPTTWTSADTSIAKVKNGFSSTGEGVIRRNSPEGNVIVTAVDNTTSLSATVNVVINKYTIDSLRVVTQNGTVQKDIDNLTIRVDQTKNLIVLGFRSDEKTWNPVDADWSISDNSALTAPTQKDSWLVNPADTASGIISVSLGTATDSLTFSFIPGLPTKIDIYDQAGNPDTLHLTPYPLWTDAPINLKAGDSLSLFAKMFDLNNLWLSQFDGTGGASIEWAVNDTLIGKLTSNNGYNSVFKPQKAYDTATIVTKYSFKNDDNNTIEVLDSIRIAVIPGDASKLFIELNPSATASPNDSAPAVSITLNSKTTHKSVYAILRDKFNNFIKASNPTSWASMDTLIVNVRKGFVTNGEGVVYRTGTTGNVVVTATDDSLPTLTASVNVELLPYTIDSLRVVMYSDSLDSLIDITSLTMRTDQDTTIKVIGLRSDTAMWIPVNAEWSSPNLSIAPNAPASDSVWSFSPNTPANGFIIVKNDTLASDTLSVTFNPGLPANLILYDPTQNPPLPYSATYVTVKAGDTVAIEAQIFDKFKYKLTNFNPDSAKSSSITWKVEEALGFTGDSTGKIEGSGARINYLPTEAFTKVSLIASYMPDSALNPLTDTLRLNIVAGLAHHVVIESAPNAEQTKNDNPLDTLKINSVDTLQSAYLIVRDKFGNFVSQSQYSNWSSLDTTIVRAKNGTSSIGEGRIRRVASGITIVTALDTIEPNLQITNDSVYVEVVNYYYTELKIRINDTTTATSLEMTTNDDTTLYAYGKRSDDGNWEPVKAVWAISDSLKTDPQPSISSEWAFSPNVPGKGFVRLYLNNETTKPDTIPVVFNIGPPVKVILDILTPEDQHIAGQPITAVIKIKNENGLVPGIWCYKGDSGAIYSDKLSDGEKAYDPRVTIGGMSNAMNVNGKKNLKVDQCFNNGIDTISFTLYYAPVDKDSIHEITAYLGNLSATKPIWLNYGTLDHIRIENLAGDGPDSIRLRAPDDAITIRAVGYDKYNNIRGLEYSDWEKTDSLHDLTRPNNTPQIFYTTKGVNSAEGGYIIATALDTTGGIVFDTLYVYIAGPRASLTGAVTKDLNGNGYLDAIEIVYDKPITMPDTLKNVTFAITVNEPGQTPMVFIVDSITYKNSDSTDKRDSVFVLHFTEQQEFKEPQTNMTPVISIGGIDDAVDVSSYTTSDGAGPVIWSVVKVTNSAGNRREDKVTVIFSEPIIDTTGSSYSVSNAPSDIFTVWSKDSTGTLVKVDSIFSGISSLESVDGNKIVFRMSNNAELTGNHFLSVDSVNAHLSDNAPNPNKPLAINQPVVVIVEGAVGQIVVGPNPIMPTFNHSEKVLTSRNPIDAFHWVENEGGGIFTSDFLLPSGTDQNGKDVKVEARMMIFDVLGNLVYTRSNKNDIIPQSWRDDWKAGTLKQLVFYWNGITDQNRKAAPGIYRMVVYLYYNGTEQKLMGNLGIGR